MQRSANIDAISKFDVNWEHWLKLDFASALQMSAGAHVMVQQKLFRENQRSADLVIKRSTGYNMLIWDASIIDITVFKPSETPVAYCRRLRKDFEKVSTPPKGSGTYARYVIGVTRDNEFFNAISTYASNKGINVQRDQYETRFKQIGVCEDFEAKRVEKHQADNYIILWKENDAI